MTSTKKRTFVKSVIYEALTIPFDAMILWVMFYLGLLHWIVSSLVGISGFMAFSHVVIYYFFDRGWKRVRWGKFDTIPERTYAIYGSSVALSADSKCKSCGGLLVYSRIHELYKCSECGLTP